MTLDQKTFTFDEVCKHNKNKECWLIIAGKVYDVTQFKDIHPGSDVMLLGAMGIDATKDHEEVAHSDEAKKMMEKYYVGKIDESTLPVKFKANNSNNILQLVVNMLQFLVPFVILGMAFTVRAYTKENSA